MEHFHLAPSQYYVGPHMWAALSTPALGRHQEKGHLPKALFVPEILLLEDLNSGSEVGEQRGLRVGCDTSVTLSLGRGNMHE